MTVCLGGLLGNPMRRFVGLPIGSAFLAPGNPRLVVGGELRPGSLRAAARGLSRDGLQGGWRR